MSSPKSSPDSLVNLLIKEQAPSPARRKSSTADHTHTLSPPQPRPQLSSTSKKCNVMQPKNASSKSQQHTYHAAQAKKSSGPSADRALANRNMNVYTKEVGSETPTMRRGCPPITDCKIPQIAVEVNVCTAVITPSVHTTEQSLFFRHLENHSLQ
jgi:hypothetical protein